MSLAGLVLMFFSGAVAVAVGQADDSRTNAVRGAKRGTVVLRERVQRNHRFSIDGKVRGKRKSVRVKIRGTGTQEDAPKGTSSGSDGAATDENERFYDTPLHGWLLFHDGKFDPLTESAYDTLGATRVYNIGQGDDLQSFESGRVDIDGVISKLTKRYPGGIDGYVTLDWEEPFFEILHGGPEHPGYEETRDHVRDFILRFKAAFPNARVTHYNLPTLPYWGKNSEGRTVPWNRLDDAEKSEMYEELEAMRVLLDDMDWFSPRFYDFIPTDHYPEDQRALMRRDEFEYRKDMVAWLRTYVDKSDRTDRPIVPVVRSSWVGGASGYEGWVDHDIPVEEFVEEQLMPALKGGADGVMLWEGWEMWMQHLTSINPDTISPELLEKALGYFRIVGILDENEVPDWRSAAEMRERLKALGRRQMPYVAATASLMRQLAPPSRQKPAPAPGKVRKQVGGKSGSG